MNLFSEVPTPLLLLQPYATITITWLLFCDLPDVPCWVHTYKRPCIFSGQEEMVCFP